MAKRPTPIPAVPARVLTRCLGARLTGGASGETGGQADRGPALLDACREPETDRFRAFFRTGTECATLTSLQSEPASEPPHDGCALIVELRDISGGVMVTGRDARAVPRIAFADPGTIAEIPLSTTERDLFAGRNAALAFRLEEPADVVAEWLGYHAHHHGLQGAVIVNRAPPNTDDPDVFADELRAILADRGIGELTIVIVDPGVALGKADLPPENHPFMAPDAPGKDRMTVPAPDPWRAPLGEAAIYEALKWRWLADARAVLTLDVTDILEQRHADAPTAFDLCCRARGGVVLMVGRRIYPWRVRKGQAASFGDHICRQFDSRRGIARWGVAPGIAGLDNTWRAIRVSYAKPDPGVTVRFYRAMALRVPGRASSELAPKTSLVEDPALIDLSTSVFRHKPVRAPVSEPRVGPVARSDRTCIVTTMKNEGPFILEWIAYHRAIGVRDFLIYTNDCTDGTDTLLNCLQAAGIVQHRDNPFRASGLKPQHAALQAAEDEPVVRNAGWTICMDVDEFMNIRIGDGTLPALYAAMDAALPGANMIALTWRLFGNGDVDTFEDRFVIEQFTACAPEVVRKPHQAWGFKTLFRNIDIYKKLGVHRPKGLRPDLWDQVRWLNGSGDPMPREMFRNGWRSTMETYGYDWVSLNHYAVRSAESFLVKRDRGRVNHVDRDQGLNYWFRMNHNAVHDTSIQRMLPAMRAHHDKLVADPATKAAHDAAVAAHRAKIVHLREAANYAAFHAELTGARMRSLSRRLAHFGSAVFSAGPGVIPDDIALAPSLAPDFFFTVEHAGDAEH